MDCDELDDSRGVGEGTATTAMAIPFVGTPKLSGHKFRKITRMEENKARYTAIQSRTVGQEHTLSPLAL